MPQTPSASLVPGRPAWCFHIGPVLDYRGRLCHFAWKYDCEVHGHCYLQPQRDDQAAANCRDCPDYTT